MGGNALKKIVTRRYELDEYKKAVEVVVSRLSEFNSSYIATAIPAYGAKDSFGDMDVLYASPERLSYDTVEKLFAPDQIVVNYDVISFNYNQLQVDLIHAPVTQYEYALRYFAFNDCGNLVGKLAHKFGLKHGHQGLYLPIRDNDIVHGNVLLTLDHSMTLKFLGLDYNRYEHALEDAIHSEKSSSSFETLDDIFEFISSSPHYNPEFYKLENLNAIAKIRDKKRSTYRAFLDYGSTYTGPVGTFVKDKSTYLEQIFDFFPEARPQFVNIMKDMAFGNAVRAKFNGSIVQELTELSGRSLGGFMQTLRRKFNFSPEMILKLSDSQIRKNIETEFAVYQQS